MRDWRGPLGFIFDDPDLFEQGEVFKSTFQLDEEEEVRQMQLQIIEDCLEAIASNFERILHDKHHLKMYLDHVEGNIANIHYGHEEPAEDEVFEITIKMEPIDDVHYRFAGVMTFQQHFGIEAKQVEITATLENATEHVANVLYTLYIG